MQLLTARVFVTVKMPHKENDKLEYVKFISSGLVPSDYRGLVSFGEEKFAPNTGYWDAYKQVLLFKRNISTSLHSSFQKYADMFINSSSWKIRAGTNAAISSALELYNGESISESFANKELANQWLVRNKDK